MNAGSGFKRMLGYFPLASWRQAWRRLRIRTLPAVRRRLSHLSGFSIRSPQAPSIELPADLDPGIEAITLQCLQLAREQFLSGASLAPLAQIAEKGVRFRGLVSECFAHGTDQIHALSVYPLPAFDTVQAHPARKPFVRSIS